MNAPHEEAVEFAKQSKRENRVYVGNLSYDVKYRDLMEFMRGGGWGLAAVIFGGFGGGGGPCLAYRTGLVTRTRLQWCEKWAKMWMTSSPRCLG